jgi:hypothetical protein
MMNSDSISVLSVSDIKDLPQSVKDESAMWKCDRHGSGASVAGTRKLVAEQCRTLSTETYR